jgi:ribosomal protein L17
LPFEDTAHSVILIAVKGSIEKLEEHIAQNRPKSELLQDLVDIAKLSKGDIKAPTALMAVGKTMYEPAIKQLEAEGDSIQEAKKKYIEQLKQIFKGDSSSAEIGALYAIATGNKIYDAVAFAEQETGIKLRDMSNMAKFITEAVGDDDKIKELAAIIRHKYDGAEISTVNIFYKISWKIGDPIGKMLGIIKEEERKNTALVNTLVKEEIDKIKKEAKDEESLLVEFEIMLKNFKVQVELMKQGEGGESNKSGEGLFVLETSIKYLTEEINLVKATIERKALRKYAERMAEMAKAHKLDKTKPLPTQVAGTEIVNECLAFIDTEIKKRDAFKDLAQMVDEKGGDNYSKELEQESMELEILRNDIEKIAGEIDPINKLRLHGSAVVDSQINNPNSPFTKVERLIKIAAST